MKIMHIYRDYLDDGGVPHLIRRLTAAQLAAGDELLVVTGERRPSRVRSGAVYEAGRLLQLPIRLSALRTLETTITAFRPDIVHVTGLTLTAHHLWLRAVHASGLPYIVSPYGQLSPVGLNLRFGEKPNARHMLLGKKVVRRIADLPALRRAAAVHVECDFAAELAESAGARSIFVLPIGIDDEWVNRSVALERKLHSPPTFLYLGRLDIVQKGLDLVLDAAQALAARSRRRFQIVLAGSSVSNSTPYLKHEVRRRGLAPWVQIRAPVWDRHMKEALWREADFFLSVYRYGGMPRATAEAVGNGLPLLASRESHWGDWTRLWHMGVVAQLTSTSVTQSMASLLRMPPADYSSMARNAHDFAVEHAWPHIATSLRSHYESVLSLRAVTPYHRVSGRSLLPF